LNLGSRNSASSDVLLKKWLNVPDGICISREMQWIAVSNHEPHSVFVYKKDKSLNEFSGPDGILRGIHYPHGLRFSSDGRFIIVADAGRPYVAIYQKDDLDWRGVRYPFLSFRTLNNEDFLRGRHNMPPALLAGEGGPKGIDIDDATNAIVTTCEMQPLAFFDLDAILESACEEKSISNYSRLSESWRLNQRAREVSCELEILNQEKEKTAVNTEFRKVINSRSWRITAPVRDLMAKVRRLRPAQLAQEAEGVSSGSGY
jgi:hypothetical protein